MEERREGRGALSHERQHCQGSSMHLRTPPCYRSQLSQVGTVVSQLPAVGVQATVAFSIKTRCTFLYTYKYSPVRIQFSKAESKTVETLCTSLLVHDLLKVTTKK